MAAAASDNLMEVGLSTATTLSAPGYTAGDSSITVGSTSNWPTATGIIFAIDTVSIVNGVEVQDAGTYCEFEGTVASGTSITNVDYKDGNGDQNFSAGSTTRVYIPVSKTRENRIVTWGTAEHNQDGTHSDVTATSVTATTGTFTNLSVTGSATSQGWAALGDVPDTVTANGNKSYDLVFNSNDLTDTITPGMRLETTRTVAAPDQCTSLDGSTQYYSKSSPSGMTFTDDFSVSAWIKLTSYGSRGTIAARYNGTSGWILNIEADGVVRMIGLNAGSGNFSRVQSYQSVPLNKWVHISAQLDMSAYSASTTNSYVMMDGVDVPAVVLRGGTNPTALVQAGNLEIGSYNGGTDFFPGKLAQVAIYSAKVTQATHLAAMNQGLAGTETSLISAYSFDGVITDLASTGNDLTANGSAVATNDDSPFGNSGVSTTLDYAIVMAASFSTNTTLTVQVPEGCTIPTSGGVSTVNYSTQSVPYGFPREDYKWYVETVCLADLTKAIGSLNVWYDNNLNLTIPVGSWMLGYQVSFHLLSTVSGVRSGSITLETTKYPAVNNNDAHPWAYMVYFTGMADVVLPAVKELPFETDAQDTAILTAQIDIATGSESWKLRGARGLCTITAKNAYL